MRNIIFTLMLTTLLSNIMFANAPQLRGHERQLASKIDYEVDTNLLKAGFWISLVGLTAAIPGMSYIFIVHTKGIVSKDSNRRDKLIYAAGSIGLIAATVGQYLIHFSIDGKK